MISWTERLPLVSLTTFTLQDFPGRTACILWFTGCQMACPFCHNSDFATGEGKRIDVEDTLAFLRKRRRMLDGVTFSGGECLLSPSVVPMIRAVKELGYAVKVDTNGGMPDRLRELIEEGLVDYVAMDFKAPLDDYKRLTGWGDTGLWQRSLGILRNSKVDFELRTTVHPELLDEASVNRMLVYLEEQYYRGSYFLQHFQKAPRTLGNVADASRRFDLGKLDLLRDFSIGFRNFTTREVQAATGCMVAVGER
ncbi:anaerobic ribonucleoside-triphosphate reductase activating protein [Verrucomicrobiia bacterium DG1235]|nr:anaerobic ribonucleoside-triphosphate reductase activating protein [Verrucomicrobiae bacterium DG1235]